MGSHIEITLWSCP